MGDGVNFCSRLEELNKRYETSVIISEAVRAALSESSVFFTRPIDYVAVKGRKQAVVVHEVRVFLKLRRCRLL
jgi:adenylate cyclase